MEKLEPLSLKGINPIPLKERKSKVNLKMFGRRYSRGESVAQFLDGLPQILGAQDLREIIDRIVRLF